MSTKKEKTITQLEEATVLNETDVLVLAQEGQSMARKATVAALAGKMGEVLAEGGGKLPVLTWYKEQEGTTITAVGLEDAELVKVYKNGLLLEPEADYTISGEEITFVTALELSDKITTEVY